VRRSVVITIAVLSLISLAKAQEPSADQYPASTRPLVPGLDETVGQLAPDVTFVGEGGKETTFSTYRGKPLLIDLWATWCGPCLANLPSLNRIYTEFKGKGIEVVSFDADGEDGTEGDAATATKYLAQHHYDWKNFHDTDRKVAKALKWAGIPLLVLIDAKGKIVYFDFGGHNSEANLRNAIARLGPDFAPVALRTKANLTNPRVLPIRIDRDCPDCHRTTIPERQMMIAGE
jgi:thiol-disulfide isomerase/thioredoxin